MAASRRRKASARMQRMVRALHDMHLAQHWQHDLTAFSNDGRGIDKVNERVVITWKVFVKFRGV